MSTKSFYGIGQGSFYGGGMYGNGQPPVGFIEKTIGPAAIASFNDGLKNKPLKKCVVNIEPIQEGSGDPSPDNVRPISCWTGAKVTKMGKNLLPNKTYQWVTNNLIIGDDTNRYGVYLKAGTYTISANRTKSSGIYCATETSGNKIIATSSALSGTLVVPNDDYYKFWLYSSTGVSASDVEWFQLEVGSTATAYEPYQGETYDITFPTEAGTIYGGTLDVTNGVLTVDRAMVDIGDLVWSKSNVTSSVGGNVFTKRTTSFDPPMAPRLKYTENTMLSDQFKTGDSNLWFIDYMADYEMFSNAINIYISASDYDDANDFMAAMSGVQLVYELAEPVVYRLSPVEITTLLGENNVWADTGDITIKYLAKK